MNSMTYGIKTESETATGNVYTEKMKTKRHPAFLLDNQEYQGWSNYNTWKVALNIDNDQPLYEESWSLVKNDEIKNGEEYKEWFMSVSETDQPEFYKVSDGWSSRELEADVNWDELYEQKKRDIKEDEEYRKEKGE